MSSHGPPLTSMTSPPQQRGRAISPSLKAFAMRCVDAELLTVQQCAAMGAFSITTGNRLRNEWLDHGRSLGPPKLGGMHGRPRAMSGAAVEAMVDVLEIQENLTLKDIQEILVSFGFETFSLSLLSRQLKRMGLSRKEVVKASRPEQGAMSESSQSGSLARPKGKGKAKGASDGATLSRPEDQ